MYTDTKKMAARIAQNTKAAEQRAPQCTLCGKCRPVAAYGGWLCATALDAAKVGG